LHVVGAPQKREEPEPVEDFEGALAISPAFFKPWPCSISRLEAVEDYIALAVKQAIVLPEFLESHCPSPISISN
jgi:hypothetical protein